MQALTDIASLSYEDVLMVFATNYFVGKIKSACRDMQLPEWGERLNTLLPFIVPFLVCLVFEQKFDKAINCSIRIGMYATFTFNFYKKTVKGE